MRRCSSSPIPSPAVQVGACGGAGVGGDGDTGGVALSHTFADDFARIRLTHHRVDLHGSFDGIFRGLFESRDGVLCDDRRLGDGLV